MSKQQEIVLNLFGPLTCERDGEPLPRLRTKNGYLTLALLALRAGTPVRRDYLIGNLWPESGDTAGSYNLRRVLSDMRGAFGSDANRLISHGHHSLTWDAREMTIDVRAFDAAAARWEKTGDIAAAQEALTLYRGPLMEGFDAPFIAGERAAREQFCLVLLEATATLALTQDDPERALLLLRRAERMDPLRQSVQRLLYQALAAQGDSPAAERAYRNFRILLHRETGQEPDAETKELRATGFGSGNHDRTRPLPNPPKSETLPSFLTPFYGREKEQEQIRLLLATPQIRMVTLTGLGGIGKTRLAVAAAERRKTAFREGIRFVPLVDLTRSEALPEYVLGALGFRRTRDGDPLTQLCEALIDQSLLLILDNMEQLLPDGAQFAETLLKRLPHLKILVTSRQSLYAVGEREFPIPPLPVPDLPDSDDHKVILPLAALRDFPSVQLFVEKAKARRPDFELAPENAEAVASLCVALDGIPLAIELAAAWAATLTPAETYAHLKDRFRILATRHKDFPERQSSLRAVLDTSYFTLPPPVQRFFTQLSVFRGGWTLEAAEAVCTPVPEVTAFEALAQLREASLILSDREAEATRYYFLETVRAYATLLLTDSERETTRQRHREYYHARAQVVKASLNTPQQSAAFVVLERDYANVRTALETAERLSDSQPNLFYDFVISLHWFWVMRGGEREMRYWLERAVDSERRRTAPDAAPGEVQMRAQLREMLATALHYEDRDTYQTARRLYLEAEDLYLRVQIPQRAAMMLNCLASVEIKLANHRAAETCLKKNLINLAEQSSSSAPPGRHSEELRMTEAVARNYLGEVHCDWGEYTAAQTQFAQARLLYQDRSNGSLELNEAILSWSIGDLAKAERLFQETLKLRRRSGFLPAQAFCLASLGFIAALRNDHADARQLHDQAVGLLDEREQAYRVALARLYRGASLVLAGEYEEAESDLAYARRLAHRMQERRLIFECLEFQADAALLAHGDHHTAISFWAKAALTRAEVGIPLPPVLRPWREARYAEAKAALGEETFDTLWLAALFPSQHTAA